MLLGMATNHPSEEILKWSEQQPPWRQDALRRILVGQFSEKDEDAVFQLLKAEYGIEKTNRTAEPLTAEHLPAYAEASEQLRVNAIEEVANVNRLTPGAALPFAADGLTVIYGDNGSGKSG